MDLTKNQISLMEHTISGRHRNWFGTDYGMSDSDEFEKLVKLGFATKENPPSWMGDEVIYRLTVAGRKAIDA